jgi:hypothetical protein
MPDGDPRTAAVDLTGSCLLRRESRVLGPRAAVRGMAARCLQRGANRTIGGLAGTAAPDPERLFAAFSYCIARGSFVDDGCLGQNGIRRTDLYGTSAGVAGSLRLDARELHDLAPFVDFGREHRSEVGG